MLEKSFYVVCVKEKHYYQKDYEWSYLGLDRDAGYPCLTNLNNCKKFNSAKEATKDWNNNADCVYLSVGKNNILMETLAVRRVTITTTFDTVVPLASNYKSHKKRLDSKK